MKVNAELSNMVRNGSYQKEQELAQDYHYFSSSSWRQRQQSCMDISQRIIYEIILSLCSVLVQLKVQLQSISVKCEVGSMTDWPQGTMNKENSVV